MKILFVDDEPNVLQGITRSLFHLADEWDIETAESGSEALEMLEDELFDVVVTDMRMPGMDGAAVLQEVHKSFPNVVRIVLSGQAELDATLRVVPVAHQFLTKPCQADVLQEVVERACHLHSLLNNDSLRQMVGHVKNLPAVPRVYAELTQALTKPDTGVGDVADIVSTDPAMCAKALQLVNSSFFANAMPITDPRQAVVRLGIRMVKALALMVEVFGSSGSPLKARSCSLEAEQRHALQVGAIARSLYDDRLMADDAFMAGMLHDVGKLIMAAECPELVDEATAKAEAQGRPLHEVETELWGVSHAEIGGYLLGVWGIPYRIVEAVVCHHDPNRVPHGNGFDLLSSVYVANTLARSQELDPDYVERVGIADQLSAWKAAADRVLGGDTA